MAPIILDGGMGTMLQASGLQPGETPEDWNIDHAAIVQSIHREYILAGATVVYTNTFGANRLKYQGKYDVKTMCRALKISESGYYRWLKNRNKPTARTLLSVEIKAILDQHPDNDNYGVNRMKTALEQDGIRISRRTVYRAMSEMKLLPNRRTPHGTTKATTEIQDRENLLKRDFKAEKPLKKLLSDITEIQCSDGKLYLSAVLDCFNGEILSVSMDDNMKP